MTEQRAIAERATADVALDVRVRALRLVGRVATGRAWRLKAIVSGILLAYLMAFPSLDMIRSPEFDGNWTALQQQFEHPLQPHRWAPQSHEASTAFRLTVPILAHLLGFRHRGALVLQILSGIALLWLALELGLRVSGDPVIAILCMAGFATTFPGIAAFCDDYRGLFDGVAFALLLGAMWVRSAPLVFACLLLAAFTDERALLASPLVLVWWWLEGRPRHEWSRLVGGVNGRAAQMAAVVAAWGAYAATRTWLVRRLGFAAAPGGALHDAGRVFVRQLSGFPFGIWTALETLWIPVIAAIALLISLRERLLAAVIVVSVGLSLIVANSVTDVTRSAAYVCPVVFVALRILQGSETRERLQSLVLVSCALAIVIPTYYTGLNEIHWYMPAPLQWLRMALHGRA